MVKFGAGAKLLFVVASLAVLAFAADRLFGRARIARALGLRPARPEIQLSAGDFPSGAAAPVGDLATVPPRPMRLFAVPRGATASLLWAAGGSGTRRDAPSARAFGLELDLTLVPDERAVAQALAVGGDRGGADAAVLSADRLAQLRASLPDAPLKAILLLSRSRGSEVLAGARGVEQLAALRGKTVAVSAESASRYYLMWALSQSHVPLSHVTLLPAASPADAARLLREGRADAAAGLASDLSQPVQQRGGRFLSSTADAPNLLAHLLVVRSHFLARYPDAARRLARAALDGAEACNRDPTEAARLLAVHAPLVGDPFEALRSDPLAGLADNLSFFGVRGDAPVRFDELYTSAGALWRKLGEPGDEAAPTEARDLGPVLAAAGLTPQGEPLHGR